MHWDIDDSRTDSVRVNKAMFGLEKMRHNRPHRGVPPSCH